MLNDRIQNETKPVWLVSLEALAQRRGGDDPRVVGGKAARLAWLVRHGFDAHRSAVKDADDRFHGVSVRVG